MSKSIESKPKKRVIRLHIKAGSATPAPPIGPALSQHKINIPTFCKAFNDQTRSMQGYLPVDIIVGDGGKYTLKIHSERTSDMIRKELGLEKGSSNPGREEFKTVTREQLRRIALHKMPDMTSANEEAAINTIAGTARSMGIRVIT
jgi:large subunit ribosomal protein L11